MIIKRGKKMRIDELLRQAREMKASDLHVSVGIPPKCRVNGELVALPCGIIMPNDSKALVEQMIPPRMIEKFNEDGEIDFSYAARNLGRFRVNVFKQRGALSFVIRLVNSKIPSPEQLGLSKEIVDLTKKKRGLVLVTGPTGSGKSTTLYTALSELNTEDINIITVEDPVEANLDGVNQVQVNAKADMTFASALRSILRQDPDIIMIGEIRDEETAEIAVQASITGHLVVSTLHTNSAAGTITRMLNMGVEGYLLADSVIGVIAQRLVRRLCPNCKQPHKPTEYERKLLNLDDLDETMIFEAKGCPMCANTGYKGRIGVYEMMEINTEMKNAIAKDASTAEIKHLAVENGMETLAAGARRKVLEGITSVSELVGVSAED